MRVRIEDWIADDRTDTLQSGDRRCKVERRAMAVLMELARRPGQVLSKDDLILTVWGRYAISDHSVAIVISDLRKAMGDDRAAPRYIETVTKRGYRLVAAVEILDDEVAEATKATPLPESARAPGRPDRRLVLAGGGAILVAAAAATAAAIVVPRLGRPKEPIPVALAQFSNQTGSADLDHVAYALSELVSTRLVEGGAGVVRWKAEEGPADDLAVLREALGGGGGGRLVTGRLLVDDGRPVLAVQVADVADRRVLWASTYPVRGTSLAPQSREIARDLAASLGQNLPEMMETAPAPAEAHELYWRARYLWGQREEGAARRARDLLLQLIRSYPDYAPAHAALADIYAHKSGEMLELPRTDTFAEAQRHLTAARRLGGSRAEVEVTQGILAFYRDMDPVTAAVHLRRALAANDRNALAWQTSAMVFSAQGRHAEAIEAIDRARALDAASFGIAWDRVWFLYAAGRFNEALAAARQAERVSAPLPLYQALILQALGRRRDALEAWIARARIKELSAPALADVVRDAARLPLDGAYATLARVSAGTPGYVDHGVPLAVIQLNAGARDQAVNTLLDAGSPRDGWLLIWAPRMPALAPLRDDPRLAPLMARMRAYQRV